MGRQTVLCWLNMKFEAGSSKIRLDGWARMALYALLRSLYFSLRLCGGNHRGFKQIFVGFESPIKEPVVITQE